MIDWIMCSFVFKFFWFFLYSGYWQNSFCQMNDWQRFSHTQLAVSSPW
jgi:hypothetical protein